MTPDSANESAVGRAVARVAGVCKDFGHTRALIDATVEFRAGEVHVLLGENGAGKSTLLNVISGRLEADRGEVLVDGGSLPPGDPGAAAEAGIAAVYQEFMLVPTLTALENIRVASHRRDWATNRRSALAHVEATIERFELPVELDVPIARLSLPERQRIEIVRALCEEPRLLLLDEATGLLSAEASEVLLDDLRRMARRGAALVLVTHRLKEAAVVGDRVTVMRRGRVIHEFRRGELPPVGELATLIVGNEVPALPPAPAPRDEVLLAVRGLSAAGDREATSVEDVDLTLRAGEILGIAGVDGNGQEQMLQAIAGLIPCQGGSVELAGRFLQRLGYADRRSAGLVFVPADRRHDGIFPGMTTAENLRVGNGLSAAKATEATTRAGIAPADPGYRADWLSGGNQQKLILARSLAGTPQVLLLAHPLRGLDANAAQAIRAIMIDCARRGAGILVAWNDIEELVQTCHRWVVLDRGRVVGEQDRDHVDLQEMSRWMVGGDLAAGSEGAIL